MLEAQKASCDCRPSPQIWLLPLYFDTTVPGAPGSWKWARATRCTGIRTTMLIYLDQAVGREEGCWGGWRETEAETRGGGGWSMVDGQWSMVDDWGSMMVDGWFGRV